MKKSVSIGKKIGGKIHWYEKICLPKSEKFPGFLSLGKKSLSLENILSLILLEFSKNRSKNKPGI